MPIEHVTQLFRKAIMGLGQRTFGPSKEDLQRQNGLKEIIDLSRNENPLGASPRAVKKIRDEAVAINRYPDPFTQELRSLIAKEHGVGIDHVLPGNGSTELITLLGEIFIDEGDDTIIPDPTFSVFKTVTHIMGGNSIKSPLKDYRIDLKDMAEKITDRTKLIVIVNPNNPTGDILTSAELDPFVNEYGKDKIIVLDEAYGPYADDDRFPNSVKYIDKGLNVIILHTLSKVYGLAGLRVGYAVSSPEILEKMELVRNIFNVNGLAQIAAVEALKDKKYLENCLNLIREEKQFYYRALKKMGLFYISSYSNFIFVKIGVDDVKFSKALLRKGIKISPLTSQGYKGFIRITVGTHKQNEKMIAYLEETIEEIKFNK